MAEKLRGHSPAGLFGYSHMLGGYAGGQAEYARVPVRRRRPDQGPRRPLGRAGAVPLGHLPDRLHGRRDVRHQARRHRRGLGLRAGRPVRHRERRTCSAPSASSPSTASRIACAWRARRRARRDDQLRGGRRLRRAEGDDRRPRPGRLHRRGRHGGARARAVRTTTTASSRR